MPRRLDQRGPRPAFCAGTFDRAPRELGPGIRPRTAGRVIRRDVIGRAPAQTKLAGLHAAPRGVASYLTFFRAAPRPVRRSRHASQRAASAALPAPAAAVVAVIAVKVREVGDVVEPLLFLLLAVFLFAAVVAVVALVDVVQSPGK